jgi:hypothetical protein
VWDEAEERWKIPSLEIKGGEIEAIRERSMTRQSLHRPETDYARQRRDVDSNPRWRTENVVDLEMTVPARSTPHRDDPNTVKKIRTILAMDLEGDSPAKTTGGREKHQRDQSLGVKDGPSEKSISKHIAKGNDNAKRDESSQKSSSSQKSCRPTTAI